MAPRPHCPGPWASAGAELPLSPWQRSRSPPWSCLRCLGAGPVLLRLVLTSLAGVLLVAAFFLSGLPAVPVWNLLSGSFYICIFSASHLFMFLVRFPRRMSRFIFPRRNVRFDFDGETLWLLLALLPSVLCSSRVSLWMCVCLGHARCRSLLRLFFLESPFSGWAQSHVPGFAGTSAHAVALFQLRARQQEAEWALCVSAVAFALRPAGGHLDSLLGNPTRCQYLQVFSLEPIFFKSYFHCSPTWQRRTYPGLQQP